ncbi:MAG: FtsX-like permease family protein, partial [Thalassolituus sp.]
MRGRAAEVSTLLLALRLLRREVRSGELTLIFLSLVLAVTVSAGIALFSQRLDLAMEANANDMLGADLRIRSSDPLSDEWLDTAREQGLNTARTLTFPSMVLADGEMALAAVKAVDDGYPLRGELRVRGVGDSQASLQDTGPQPGEVWVEGRVLSLLRLEFNQDTQLELGGKPYRVTGIIEKESDRGGNFYTLSPRVMLHWSELEGSPMLGPGSRLAYRLLVSGDESDITAFRDSVELDVNQEFESLRDGNRAMSESVDRARRYLGLAAVLAVVLASVAVAVSARRYSERHFDVSALMRTFGLSRKAVLVVFLWQLLCIGLLATLFGGLAALFLQESLIYMLSGLVPDGLPPAGPFAWLVGLSAGVISLFGFGVPHLLPLSAVSPLRVLRRDITPVPVTGWLLYGVALVAMTTLLWLLTRDALMSAAIILGGALILVLLMALLRGLLSLAGRALQNRTLPLSLRFAWQHLSRDRTATAGQLLAFALTLMVMIVTGMLRTDLLEDWQQSLPDDAPNIFALNIQPFDRTAFLDGLDEQGLDSVPLYPMVPMRLTAVNGTTVSELDIAGDRSIDRDLISSEAGELPENNTVTAGNWETTHKGPGQVSVEAELAERLGFELGDVLTFRAAGVNFDAQISSLRSLDWTSMTPNFYMMLSPDLLEALPKSYMTSFHLPGGQDAALNQLVRNFPGITFIDTRYLIAQVNTLLQRLILAVELILVFVLIGAVLVMLSVLLTSTRERLAEGAILRTLGASRVQVRRAHQVEFILLGGLAALLALVGGELLVAGLYVGVLEIPYSSLGWIWAWLIPVTIIGLMVPGSMMLRRVT